MDGTGPGCGPLHALYAAARDGEVESMTERWRTVEPLVADLDGEAAADLAVALAEGDAPAVREHAGSLLFVDEEPTALDGAVSRVVGRLLYAFGYLAAYVLFARAHTPVAVVGRLRWAYRTVGVDIRDTEAVAGTERTVFRCPYRTVGAGRVGTRRVCHDVLDRVDDGYVTWLARHRDIDYDRPRACAASECCYSEVTER